MAMAVYATPGWDILLDKSFILHNLYHRMRKSLAHSWATMNQQVFQHSCCLLFLNQAKQF
ncbi:MAG TPA: hypothetical protein DDZ51_09250 [Planctomycetaceae bacterium]|nr:hypothetical protein [Planctomycetaceae bacterium]